MELYLFIELFLSYYLLNLKFLDNLFIFVVVWSDVWRMAICKGCLDCVGARARVCVGVPLLFTFVSYCQKFKYVHENSVQSVMDHNI